MEIQQNTAVTKQTKHMQQLIYIIHREGSMPKSTKALICIELLT